MHHRLLTIVKEEKLQGDIKIKDVLMDGHGSTLLSTAYAPMEPINAANRQIFADRSFFDGLFDALNLIATGATITTIAKGMKGIDTRHLGIEVTDKYRVAR